MKILVVSQNFYPDNFKINDVVKEFTLRGHEVTVLTGLGGYTTGKLSSRYKLFKNRKEVWNHVNIRRVRTITRRKGPIFRSLNYFSFTFFGSIWALLNREHFDVIYVYQLSPVTMAYPALIAAKKRKIPILLYCLDIWPESVKAMRLKEGTFIYSLIHKISRYLYRKSHRIAVSSQSFMEYLHTVNQVPYEKMDYIPQYANDSSLAIQEQERAETRFVFTGNIGYVQDVETILLAVSKVDPAFSLKVDIVGNGSALADCEKLADQLSLNDRVIFHGRQPAEKMHEYYQDADACLLTLKNQNKIGLTIPAKLQGYMVAGKPIIAAIDGDAKVIIHDANCGICVPASQAEALAQAMVDFMNLTHQEQLAFGKNARAYYESHFTEAQFIDKTLQELESLDVLKKERSNNEQ
ncbi:glycosyltransferase family 4 protein [Isobaculum melis]|uniref:Glycosyltransferase involved in cell wall bisynthesis n=1 Tax=Isobaculum melis TaxID=142588 RepID=A0A1H9QP29_9LACT|nr:glycosyltransferase family 4 protein [Isobaculum melis]SER62167.1 Glycosyltransferase involved in cell wall bisynthesis [Isobaculum melis]